MDNKILSFVIPCFNHGEFLKDAIKSVDSLNLTDFEILIVDDGSTDKQTIDVLSQLQTEGYSIIHQLNQGLARARNIGVSLSKGKYIIPLDADNKLNPLGVTKALEILERGEADIVYGNPVFFGEVEASRLFQPKPMDIYEIFRDNYIDACAIFRKEVWVVNGGYQENMPFSGHEDWEFWINAFKNGFRFEYINLPFFYYRILSNSMITHTNHKGGHLQNHKFIIEKHFEYYKNLYTDLNSLRKKRGFENAHPFRTAMKFILIGLGFRK